MHVTAEKKSIRIEQQYILKKINQMLTVRMHATF